MRWIKFIVDILMRYGNTLSLFFVFIRPSTEILLNDRKDKIKIVINSIRSFRYLYAIRQMQMYGTINGNVTNIIDVGANNGYFSIDAFLRYPKAQIYAFEPNNTAYNILSKNVSMNSMGDRIILSKSGVWSTDGKHILSNSNSPLDSSIVIKPTNDNTCIDVIAANTLMEGFEGINFLKLNCEGAEYEILYSLTKNNLSKLQYISCEYHNLPNVNPAYTGENLRQYLEINGFGTVYNKSQTGSFGLLRMKNLLIN